MKKIISVIISILVMSCDGSDNNTPPSVSCINNDSSSATVAQDSIRVSLFNQNNKPFENVVVQLDDKGVCVKSNAKGLVTFNAVSAGSHDIHVFSPAKYDWYSVYNVKVGELIPVSLLDDNYTNTSPVPVSSYVSLTGAITGYNHGNSLELTFITKNGAQSASFPSFSGGKYMVDFEFDANNIKTGTSITGDILVLEFHTNNMTNETYLVDKTVISGTFTPQAKKGVYVTKDITLLNTKPLVSTLLSFNSITFPPGHTFLYSDLTNGSGLTKSITNPRVNLNIKDNSLTSSPIIFKSYEPFNFTEYMFTINSVQRNQNEFSRWTFSKIYSKNKATNIVLNPSLTIPVIPENQTGNQITWSAVSANITEQYLYIYDTTARYRSWDIRINGNASILKLPEIPSGIIPLLTKGKKYNLYLGASLSNVGTSESYTIKTRKIWTR